MLPKYLSKTRHEIRTLLNHIVGYTEILLEDTASSRGKELFETFKELRDLALSLREPFFQIFADSEHPARQSEDTEALKRKIYGLLYDIIALVQTAKRLCVTEERRKFLPDIQKILEASNGMVDVFEQFISEAPYSEDGSEEYMPEEIGNPSGPTGSILVVDDNTFNRELLARHLERQGHIVTQAADGVSALKTLKNSKPDVILLDVMMPGMNGYQFLDRIKTTPSLRDIHVIVVSALEEPGSVARCLRLGAEDYLPREFDPEVLKARIESCLERKRLRAREEFSLRIVAQTQLRLTFELRRAAEYVRSLLPRRIKWRELHTDWIFIPSLTLGGDVFGYTRLDTGEIEFYLIDVSGHGVEAALLSVSLLNRIQAQSPEDPTLWDPARMLEGFNHSFRGEDHNNLYFSAWIGIWDPRSRVLRYSSAGSPPAILLAEDGSVIELRTESPAVGVDDDAVYLVAETEIPRGARLYLFSDGIFEVKREDGRILGLADFVEILKASSTSAPSGNLARMVESVRELSGRTRFDDDVSLLGVYFDA